MVSLDFSDIQKLIIQGYRLPYACYYFLSVKIDKSLPSVGVSNPSMHGFDNIKARHFIRAVQERITTADEHWPEKVPPEGATTNIAFSYPGLIALGLPDGTLNAFPLEFKQGMKKRAALLGDVGPSAPEHWDEVWRQEQRVHIWISINAMSEQALAQRQQWLRALIDGSDGGVVLLDKQPVALLKIDGQFTNKEHFGFSDGIANPVFEGSRAPNVPGRGKLVNGEWKPLATGEFLLGYPDEGGEMPTAPIPHSFSRNGTYMVFRKLHQRVKSFKSYLNEQGQLYPGGRDMLAAKWAGRWDNGAPLSLYPDEKPDLATLTPEEIENFNNFLYLPHDSKGKVCPLGSHIRRANPRDALGFEGKLVNRRRIIRRGLPYGAYMSEGSETDEGEHGIIFAALNASPERQFEFIQQQWIHYGNDFQLGNDKDVLIGNNNGEGKAIIQGDPPYFCPKLPHFVECRGGEYFFIPSMRALRLIVDQAFKPL